MAARKRPVRRRKNPRDRFALAGTPVYSPMTPQVPTSKVISFAKYKGIVRDQIIRFSAGFREAPDGAEEHAGRLTPQEASAIVNANETRIREAYERGLPSRRVATSLLP